VPPTPLTIGDVAKRLGCHTWQVRRVITRGLVPEPGRVGAYRVFFPEQLPAIQAALRAVGYLPSGEGARVA
jgi:DNA-binding transcriptional MerR regulator